MNPLTLDFIRRWKWLLLVQFVATTAAWSVHDSGPAGRLHLEWAAAIAMSWDLMRGTIRSQLGLPQRRPAVAAGLWLSVVGVAFGIHLAGMLLGAGVIAALRGHPADPGLLSLNAVLSLILAGTLQFLLTGQSATPPRTFAGNLKAGVFSLFWGLSIWGGMAVSFVAPQSWTRMEPRQVLLMILLGGLTVASWFTTRTMLMERAMPARQTAPVRAPGQLQPISRSAGRWSVWLAQESRWFLPVVVMVVLAGSFMISINWFRVQSGQPWPVTTADYLYRSMGMLSVMTVFPLVAVSAGTLRACRGFPVPLGHWAVLVALRPFAAGLLVFGLFTLLVWAVSGSSVVDVEALWAFLPLCSALSLGQAFMLRHPRLPVVIGLLMVTSMLGTLYPEMLRHGHPGSAWMVALASGLLVLSWRLHLRWLGSGSRIYRLNQGFRRMAGGAQR